MRNPIEEEVERAIKSGIKNYEYVRGDANYTLPLVRADWLLERIKIIFDGSDTVVLTRKEIREAMEDKERPMCFFPDYSGKSAQCRAELTMGSGLCRLCEKLTKFGQGADNEKGGGEMSEGCRYCFSLFKRHTWYDAFLHPRYFWRMWGVPRTLRYIFADTLNNLHPKKEK